MSQMIRSRTRLDWASHLRRRRPHRTNQSISLTVKYLSYVDVCFLYFLILTLEDSPRSSAHSPMLRKKSIISTTETSTNKCVITSNIFCYFKFVLLDKSKTSLRSKQTTSSLSVKSPLPPLTPKRQSRQSLDVDKQISRLAQKSQQSHHSISMNLERV